MRNIDNAWFADVMAAKGLSQRGFAKLIGVESSAISRTIAGHRKVTLPEIEQYALHLDQPVSEVLLRFGLDVESGPARNATVPVWGVVSASGNIHRSNDNQATVTAPVGLGSGGAALQCRMGVMDGWTLFFEQAEAVRRDSLGRLSVCDGDDGLCLRTIRRERHGVYEVEDQAGGFQDIALRWASPVLSALS